MKSSFLIILHFLLLINNIFLLDTKANPFEKIEHKFLKFNSDTSNSGINWKNLNKTISEKSDEDGIHIPSEEFLKRRFLKNPILYDKAHGLAKLLVFVLNYGDYILSFKLGLIAGMIEFWQNFGTITAFHGNNKFETPEILEKYYNFSKRFEGRKISEFSLSEIESMINDLEGKGLKSDKYPAIGMLKTTLKELLLKLLEYYKEQSKDNDRIEFQDVLIAEAKYILDNTLWYYKDWKRWAPQEQERQIKDAEKNIRYGIFGGRYENNNYGLLIYKYLKLDESRIEIKNTQDLIPSLTKDLFGLNIEYTPGKEFISEKNDFKIKIKGTFDLNIYKFELDKTYIISNGTKIKYFENKDYYEIKIIEKKLDLLLNSPVDDLENIIKNGAFHFNYNPKKAKIEFIVEPMTNNINIEYNEGIVYEINEKKLENEEIEIYNNLLELGFSKINLFLRPEEKEIKLKIKVPLRKSRAEIELENINKIYIFSYTGQIKYSSYQIHKSIKDEESLNFEKGEILFVYIQPIEINKNLIINFKQTNRLPYQPLKINVDEYDNSYINYNPLKPFEISYKKRKGEALCIFSNNPEVLEEGQLNKGIIRTQFSDKEIFFTMEHNSKISQSTYAGYQVRNIGETDLYITIKNIGFQLGDEGWFGEKEWVDFYNSNFRIMNTRYLKPDKFEKIKKKVNNKYEYTYKPHTTYRIPPGKYIYVLGGTSQDAFNNINVLGTADQAFTTGIINGAVLFDVKGKAEGVLFIYNDFKKIQEDNKSNEPYIIKNGKGAQYKGYDNYHGVVDGFAFWEFSDETPSGYLPVKITNYYRDGEHLVEQEPYSKIEKTIKHEYESNEWVTNANPQKYQPLREEVIGTDLIEFHTFDDVKERIIDNEHYDGRGDISNTANWMINYITSYCFVNRGEKSREVTINIAAHGLLVGLVANSDGNIIKDSAQFAISDDDFTFFHNFTYTEKVKSGQKVIFHVAHTLLANSDGRVIHNAYLK